MNERDAWTPALAQLMARTPREGEYLLFSPPIAFAMPEDEYERRIGSQHGLADGEAIFRLYRHFGGNPHGVALELGAGGGATTIGFVAAAPEMRTIVTDPSPAFLRIIQGKLGRAKIPATNVTFGTLLGEEISSIPAGSLDLVFMAACLHHVLDYRTFLEQAATALRPGGLLIFHEPFAEGYLVMAMATELMLTLDGKAYLLNASDNEKLRRMLQATYFQCDRKVPKAGYEDKHCFLTDDLLDACHRAFAEVTFLRNQSFASIAALKNLDEVHLPGASSGSIVDYLRSFLVHHHSVSESAVRAYDANVAPALARIDQLYLQGDGPTMFATVICRARE